MRRIVGDDGRELLGCWRRQPRLDAPMSDLFASAGLQTPPPAPSPTACARHPGGGRRPGAPHRAGRGADPAPQRQLLRLAGLLGPARAPARPRWRGCWRTRPTCISSRSRRSSPASPNSKKVFEAARGRRAMGQGHPALRRRDPPLQPGAARRLPARDGGRHGDARRRHHGEPLLRAQRRAPVARPRPPVPRARRRGHRQAAGRGPRP